MWGILETSEVLQNLEKENHKTNIDKFLIKCL